MKKSTFFKVVFILLLTFVFLDINAQCPMCRMSAESNLASGGSEGKGLNKGILYMLSLPYILIGTIGYMWWKNRAEADQDN